MEPSITYPYELMLPVFKKGDDLAYHLSQHQDNPIEAFRALAEEYEAAASICRRVVGVLLEVPSGHDVRVLADTHTIALTTEHPADLQGLLADKTLQEFDFEDEDEELDFFDGLKMS